MFTSITALLMHPSEGYEARVSTREGCNLHALAVEEGNGSFVGAEKAVGGDEREHHIASHCCKGDAN